MVLRWLLRETEGEAAAYLELAPGGGERLLIEPRGLDDASILQVAHSARRALIGADPENGSAARWLGEGGSRCLVLTGRLEQGVAEEPLRFARYSIELMGSMQADPARETEARLNELPGVSWAEAREGEVRLLLSPEADRALAIAEVERILEGTPLRPRWIALPGEPDEAPPPAEDYRVIVSPASRPGGAVEREEEPADGPGRVRLLGVVLNENGEVTAEVQMSWRDRELRGRGHGPRARGGARYAAAQAAADAIRPLLDSDVVVDGLYAARTKGAEVLIAEVLLEGNRLIGAVESRPGESDLIGARAVLDAVNRRLSHLAGRSGRI